MFVLGLTGSIGMGKTAVGQLFREQGVPVLDADQVVHGLYSKGGAAVDPIAAAFPSAICDGAVDRARLSQFVVNNEGNMKQLEGIVHPLVEQARLQFLAEAAVQHKLAVVDIPLLYETDADQAVDGVLVVSAPYNIQRKRVLARPGMTVEKFKAILGRQLPDATKRERADFVLDTSLTLDETREHVIALISALSGRKGEVLTSSAHT